MKTNINAQCATGQAFSSNLTLLVSSVNTLIARSEQFHSYLTLLLSKLTMCNVTMKTLEMSQAWLAKQVGCLSDRTIRRNLEPLIQIGFLKKKFRYHGKGREQTNLYTLNPLAKTPEFLQSIAKYSHEVRLYLARTAKERLRKALDAVSAKAISAKNAVVATIQKGVLPFKNPSLSSYICNIKQLLTGARARENESQPVQNHTKKEKIIPKRENMERDYQTDALKRVQRALDLTPAGAIAFAGYDDEVLLLALRDFKAQRCKINKVFGWFSSVCSSYNKKLGLKFDFLKVQYLQEYFKIDDKLSPKTVTAANKQAQQERFKNFPPRSAAPFQPMVSDEEFEKEMKKLERLFGSAMVDKTRLMRAQQKEKSYEHTI